MSGQNHVLELYRVLRQRVHEVYVELAQEKRVVLENDHHDPQCRLVELLQSLGTLLAWNHILLEETETRNDKVLDLSQTLDLLLLLLVLLIGYASLL
jgi:hypothetical protein